jgi:hypothetical protein
MATFPQHLPLVQRCAADPSGNPVCTFRRELDEAGGWARTIREGEVFVEDPRVKRWVFFLFCFFVGGVVFRWVMV